jgi:hypothetical protein
LREINERSAHLPHDGMRRPDYESGMIGTRPLAEVLRALCVLALVFLNFAHQPAMAAPTAEDVLTVAANQSFCGAPVADDEGHAPCHACRIGSGADLPPVCSEPVALLPVAVRLTAEPRAVAIERFAITPVGARAPPVF